MAAVSFSSFLDVVTVHRPTIAIILGSGMAAVARGLERRQEISFADIPDLGTASVTGHRGFLMLGFWAGKPVLVFEGRLHYYEGHSWETVTAPVRIARSLGVRRLLLTNAAGGIRDDLSPGSLMLIRDHIDGTRPYCWQVAAAPLPYSDHFAKQILAAAFTSGIDLFQGIYAAVTGPCYETAAEIRALKIWGADAVGMSTAREIQTGADLGLECAAISCITNRAAGLSQRPLHHAEVLATAAQQSDRLRRLLETIIV